IGRILDGDPRRSGGGEGGGAQQGGSGDPADGAHDSSSYLVASLTFPLKLLIETRPPPIALEIPSSIPRPSRPIAGRVRVQPFSIDPVMLCASISTFAPRASRSSIAPLWVSNRASPPGARSPAN